MIHHSIPPRAHASLGRETVQFLMPIVAAGGLLLASAVIAYALHRYGFKVLPAAAAVIPVIWAFAWPRSFPIALLAALVTFENNALDFTRPIGDSLWSMPPELASLFPLTIAPIELGAVTALVAIGLRSMRGRTERWHRVPILVLGLPLVMALGLAYGLAKGADHALAYHEMRGLLFASVAFVLAVELRDTPGRVALRWAFIATTALAVLLLIRYFGYTRAGEAERALEFAYAHESVIFLAAGAVMGSILVLRASNPLVGIALAAYVLLMLAATLATGRRSGTLVLMGAAVVAYGMLWRRRPVAASVAGVVMLAILSVYVASYWNQSYGAFAQPARAIRSQIDPNLRDESSDVYREIERWSIDVTIRSSPAFGVGFGQPFFDIGQLPRLGYWPLQFYTPHQNMLWLWLKMGALGITTFLAVWLIAAGRAVRAFVRAPGDLPMPVLPVLLGTVLTGYLFFATVDVTFSSTRAAVPLGVALGLALSILPAWIPSRGSRARHEATEAL